MHLAGALVGDGLRGRLGGRRAEIVKCDKIIRHPEAVGAQRPAGQPHVAAAPVGLEREAIAHRLMPVSDHPVPEGAQVHPQARTRKVYQLERRRARRDFQEAPDLPAGIDQLAVRVRDHVGRAKFAEQDVVRLRDHVLALARGQGAFLVARPGGVVAGQLGQRKARLQAVVLAAAEHAPLLVERLEQRLVPGDALGRAEQEAALRAQRVVEDGDQAVLQLGLQVDQHVAARQQVEPAERGILDQALRREDAELADFLDQMVLVADHSEIALEVGFGHAGRDAFGIDAATRHAERDLVDVGGEDLDAGLPALALGLLAQEHRQRIGFLASGTPGDPHPHRLARRLAQQHLVDRHLERLEGVGVAEEGGDADQKLAEELARLLAIFAQPLGVMFDRADLQDLHPPLDPPQQRRLLVEAKVMAGGDLQKLADPGELPPSVGAVVLGPLALAQVPQIIGDGRRDASGRQDLVDETGRDRAARHAVIGRALGVLDDRVAAGLLQRPHPLGAVAAGARQQDGHRPVAQLVGDRPEEGVDRRADAARRGRLVQLQAAVAEDQRRILGDDEDAVRRSDGPVAGDFDRKVGDP